MHRGDLAAARELLGRFQKLEGSSDVQSRASHDTAAAAVLFYEGQSDKALEAAERSLSARDALGIPAQDIKHAIRHALEASLALGRTNRADELVGLVQSLPVGWRPPFLDASAHRFRARLAGDSPAADLEFVAAAAGMRRLELPFHLAVVQLEHGEWLISQGRGSDAEPFLAEAHDTFERLQATVWLQRLEATSSGAPAETVA